MVPEELRNTDNDIKFIIRWKDRFPKETLRIIKKKLKDKWKVELHEEIWKIVKEKVFQNEYY